MSHEVGITDETKYGKCDYCAMHTQCYTLIIVYGSSGFQDKQICLACKSAGKHQRAVDQARFNELMKADLDGYPDDPCDDDRL